MSQFDKVYKELVETVLNKGTMSAGKVRTKYADGTPAHYISYIGYQFRLDNSTDEAHLITSRYAPYKSAIREIYWITKLRSNNVDELIRLGSKFWNEWKLEDGTIGKAYGYQLAKPMLGRPSQIDYVIDELKNNPNSRRTITEIWNVDDSPEMALLPCVHLVQYNVIGNKLYMDVRQRSCDIALGLVANVFQYSVLHKLIAKECGLEPADLIWTISNAHIYDRHIEDLKKQIELPTLSGFKLDLSKVDSFNSWTNPDDITVPNYAEVVTNKIKYEVAI